MNRTVRRTRKPRKVVWGLTLALGLAWFGSTHEVHAGAPGTFRFSWSAPDECPSQGQVESEIVRLVGGDVHLLGESDLEAEVIVAGGQPWSANLTTEHAGLKGHRTVEAPSCQAAADAIALIIALAIDPDAAAAGPSSPSAPPAAEASRSQLRELKILASAHTQGRTGTLPRADVGVGIGVGLAGTRWRAMLRGTYGLRRDQTATLPSGASGRFNITTASLTGCIDLALMKGAALGPCAVAEAGRASATGYGATAGFSRDVTWLALGGGIFSSLALSKHLRASLEVDALAPLYRPDFVFEDLPGVVFRAPALGGRALVDLSWEF